MKQERLYILAETHEKGYLFQVICISGYDAGRLCGYIEKEKRSLIDQNHQAVSKTYLLEELKRNFIFKEESFRIEEGGVSPDELRPSGLKGL